MRIVIKLILLCLVIYTASFTLAHAQDTSSEETDIDAWDKATDIYKCMENLKSEKEQVYEEANECLYYLLPRHTASLLKELGNNKEPIVRSQLAMLFAKRRIKEATPVIINLLDDKNRSVRKHAASALRGMKDVRSIPALMKLINEDDASIWSDSIGGILDLQNNVSKENIDELKKVLIKNLKHPKELRRRYAVMHLGNMKDPGMIPVLEDLLQNDTGFYLIDSVVKGKRIKLKTYPVREAARKAVDVLKAGSNNFEDLQKSTTTP